MVQGGLLTAHLGGVHGYGWSPGGGSSSRQGVGAASPGSPDLKRRWQQYREEFTKIRLILGASTPRAKYRRRGHREGPHGSQDGARRDLGWGRARDPSGVPVVAPLPSFGVSGGFRDADFLYNFSGIVGALLMGEKPEIQK